MHVARSRLLQLLTLFLAGSLGGCNQQQHAVTTGHFFPVPPPGSDLILAGLENSIPASEPFAALESYQLRAGDRIGFTLQITPALDQGTYHVAAGDGIAVEYLHLPVNERRQLQIPVKPDGTIDLPLIGQVQAGGKAVEDLEHEIQLQAKRYWRYPQVSVAVTKPLASAEELRRAFSPDAVANSQTITLPVEPDGNLELPLIGTVRAYRRTISDLREEVLTRYQERVPGVRITPFLAQRAPDRVYVLGEVDEPGVLLLDRPTTVIQAIGHAGSWRRSAELNEVVLIRGYTDGSPRASLLNLDQAIELEKERDTLDLSDDLWLHDGDIVVVPKDHIQNVNEFVERVLTRGVFGLIPSQTFVSVGNL